MRKNLDFYWTLFTETFKLSAFTFGGGYVIVPLMQKQFVEKLKWIEQDEMLNLVAIAQSAPGPIAVNTSILIGYETAGFLGALVSILGTVLPPLIIITIISHFYEAFSQNIIVGAILKGMQIGVAAVIVSVVFDMAKNVFSSKSWVLICIMFGAFIATYILDINIMVIILICALIGIIYTKNTPQKEEK